MASKNLNSVVPFILDWISTSGKAAVLRCSLTTCVVDVGVSFYNIIIYLTSTVYVSI